jgi:hypothetical protein
MSLKRSVRIIIHHARLLRTSRAALKGKTKCSRHPRSRTRRFTKMPHHSKATHPWNRMPPGRPSTVNRLTYDCEDEGSHPPVHMQRRVNCNKKVHEVYMTRTTIEPVYPHYDDSPIPNNVSANPNVINISPSSSEINRRVENQLDFATPYFDILQHQTPEPANSGGGGDTQRRKPTLVCQLKQPPPKSPMQRALTTDFAFLIDSTIQQSVVTTEEATGR